MLLDGSRLHVVIPDITRIHWSVNIRKVNAALSLDVLPVQEVTPLGWAGRRFGVTSA